MSIREGSHAAMILLQEYGIPSSHTMNSLCLNFYLAIRVIDDYKLSTLASSMLYAAVAVWVVWIAIARVYMGLHTPIDVIGGAVAGLFVLLSYLAFDGAPLIATPTSSTNSIYQLFF